MASSSLSATTATASASSFSKSTSNLPRRYPNATVSFRLSSSKPKLRFFARGPKPSWKSSTVVKAQLNDVAVEGSSNASASPPSKSEVPAAETKDAKPSNEHSPTTLVPEEPISEFISQVSNLVKLVDSRDIVELQLKQLDCELIIRKKEALPQPPASAPMVMMQSPSPPSVMPPTLLAPAPISSAPPASPAPSASASPPSASASPPPAKSTKSSLPPFKCPMAGTFYRCPGPGEPPFVKVGDKIQKGQVVCIIEAMKLMNEIEADQSGTVVEILAEDGKPVNVDCPLFVIEP